MVSTFPLMTHHELRATSNEQRVTITHAFAHTRRITYGHYENFPVASWLVPKNLRQHVCNIYAFARGADDFADEPQFSGERMERLLAWRERLMDIVARDRSPVASKGNTSGAVAVTGDRRPATGDVLVFAALAESIRTRQLPVELLNDLLTAFMLDVKKNRYAQFGEVMHYCRHSANPVGRLILHLFGYGNEQWMKLSDHICTALQLANFWQDVAVDLKKDRIYLPHDEMQHFGVTEQDLFAAKFSPELQSLMQFQVERTRALFVSGRALCDIVPHPRLRWQLRLTWLGGMRILEKISANDFNIFRRPKLGPRDWALLVWRAMRWT